MLICDIPQLEGSGPHLKIRGITKNAHIYHCISGLDSGSSAITNCFLVIIENEHLLSQLVIWNIFFG